MALILDTGPLYASLDRSDTDHAVCRRLIETADEALIIPAPVLVEVDYWIHVRLHPGVLVALLEDVDSGAYQVEELHSEDYRRIRQIVDRYADSDVGFVDAAVLAVVERLGEPKGHPGSPAFPNAATSSRGRAPTSPGELAGSAIALPGCSAAQSGRDRP